MTKNKYIMGLESINLFFHSEEPFEYRLMANSMIEHSNEHKYIYKMDFEYWIDIKMQDEYTSSIRIMLSNPEEFLFKALDKLLSLLFKLKNPVLKNMVNKRIYHIYNDEVKKDLKDTFILRKINFKDMYGDFIAAIGVDEFYEKYNLR